MELIRQGKDTLELVVISVTSSEARKLDGPAEAVSQIDSFDYSDRRGIALTIPDARMEETDGQKFMVGCLRVYELTLCNCGLFCLMCAIAHTLLHTHEAAFEETARMEL